ncbi:hypothetical protein GCM10027169_29800 [Gordonia jinhuaensis]|uniref:Uncharacterized protein n=1 Tax=Gordonia jinhuaensis TaxID=1517702 RepID=A0A916T5N2_9ACTN|nr:hypothetical protein [Gordonia jinhuaensis]GGB32662.1 hypothetical protein GCM10011489_21060 [Gordonia jinhuaensis]
MFIAVIAIIMSFIVVGALVNPYVADFDGQDIRAARRRRVRRERRAMRRDRRAARRDARLLRAIEEPTSPVTAGRWSGMLASSRIAFARMRWP